MGAVKGSDILSLPTVVDLVTQGDQHDRNRGLVSLLIATPCFLATVLLALRHQKSLLAGGRSTILRKYYRVVNAFPVVVAFTCWFQIAAPRLALSALVVQEVWEAVALHYFAMTIICLMGGEEEAVKALSGVPPSGMFRSSNRWCVPPLCCLVPALPCLFRDGSAKFDMPFLIKLRVMIEQYVYIAPLTVSMTVVVEMYTHDRAPNSLGEKGQLLHLAGVMLTIVQTVSMVGCLHALFSLYKSTHDMLERYNTTRKFLGIKSMILLSLVQKLVICSLIESGWVSVASSVISPSQAATRLQALLLGMELPLVQVLMNEAFPIGELRTGYAGLPQ